MSMDLLQVGQKLSINIQTEDKLIEITGELAELYDDRLNIDLPQYFMRYIQYLEVGCNLTIKVFSKMGTIDFNAIVISSPLEDDFSVEFDSNAMRFTPKDEIPVIKAMENIVIKDPDAPVKTKTLEISTEYLKFYSDKEFHIHERYDCDLILPKDYGTISFRLTITAVDEKYTDEYKATYYYMNEKDRQNLLYYMYVYSSEESEE